jgi:regulator of RNase E activity RraA
VADTWDNDSELFAVIRDELFSAAVGDVLDASGYHHQFLPPTVRPLKSYGVVVGRAMPVLEADVFNYDDPFGKMFDALDDLKPAEIYLAAGGSATYAFFGELMATAAIARGAHGAVLCGYHRDTAALLKMDFPVFSYGAYAQDQGFRGRVIEYRTPIEVGAVRIEPGDLIVADIDGVVIVPQQVEKAIIDEALAKVRVESELKQALQDGMLSRAAFEKYGVM